MTGFVQQDWRYLPPCAKMRQGHHASRPCWRFGSAPTSHHCRRHWILLTATSLSLCSAAQEFSGGLATGQQRTTSGTMKWITEQRQGIPCSKVSSQQNWRLWSGTCRWSLCINAVSAEAEFAWTTYFSAFFPMSSPAQTVTCRLMRYSCASMACSWRSNIGKGNTCCRPQRAR